MNDVAGPRQLYLRFHGRILDALGIQMYQSPTAAIAELIANAWDADAEKVDVTLPASLNEGAVIIVADHNGRGMTFEECQEKYLQVGRNRRVTDGPASAKGRPVLGRKGIGKFAGFGIADIVEVDTVSADNGERTHFSLDIRDLRSDDFVVTTPRPIPLIAYEGPDETRRAHPRTVVTLRNLKMVNRRDPAVFARQMAKRFQLAAGASTFLIAVNGNPMPSDVEAFDVEFEFPRDYRSGETPDCLSVIDGWARETVGDNDVDWRVRFSKQPIGEEEFRGVGIFCGIKVAQTPFFFQLSGGLGGQHGQAYMAGTVKADFLDALDRDVITTERQRINWEDPYAAPLLEWGQKRVASLLRLWQARRGESRNDELDHRLGGFGSRLSVLPQSERETIRSALRRIASVPAIDQDRFAELADAILTAWEGGRLRGIISDIARMETMDEGVLLRVLAEERVLTALHVAEVIKIKVDVIQGLEARIAAADRENSIRDYIADSPWLISPRWERYRKEIALNVFLGEARARAQISDADPRWAKRMDLVLRAGDHILVLEFMRPGLAVDSDHLQRFQTYVDTLRVRLAANTALRVRQVSGLLVADRLAIAAEDQPLLERLANADMHCLEWQAVLGQAKAQWAEFLEAMKLRAPDDPRLQSLQAPTPASLASKA